MSVDSEESIQQGFSHTNKSFDIIIDDSSHKFNDQIRIIKNSYSFLKPGGMLIIEDIFRRVPDQKYVEAIGEYEKYFDRITFILCEHQNRYSDGWDNDKILVLVRNDNN
jgi:SAM-dependent methyltransferase